jgi:hypothetical protein
MASSDFSLVPRLVPGNACPPGSGPGVPSRGLDEKNGPYSRLFLLDMGGLAVQDRDRRFSIENDMPCLPRPHQSKNESLQRKDPPTATRTPKLDLMACLITVIPEMFPVRIQAKPTARNVQSGSSNQ